MNTGHPPECVCDDCLRHQFLERVRSQVCHLCNRPRDYWWHHTNTTPPPPKPWTDRLGSIKGGKR